MLVPLECPRPLRERAIIFDTDREGVSNIYFVLMESMSMKFSPI
jgi:hypothetical protein